MLLRYIVLYKCTHLQMFKSINVHMANCIMNKCIMYKCIMNKCIMYKCIMYKCIMYKCIMCKSIMTFFIVGAGTVQRRRMSGIQSDPLENHLRINSRPSRLPSGAHFLSVLTIFKTALVSILFILELSVLDKSCLELNFQVKGIISRVPCTAVFLRLRTSGFQY